MTDGKPTVGVIGLGSMGLGVAQSLRRAGITTFGCDRRPEQLAALAAAGGKPASSPAEVGAASDVVIVLVVNAAQTREVVLGEAGCAARMRPGGVVIASSTVPPAFAEELGERLAAMGLRMLDAPVSGGMHRAAEGQLTIMASGAPDTFEAVEPVLSAIAQKVYRLGDRPGQGSKIKMVNQLLAGVHISAAAEAMALGMRAGVDPEALYEVISNSAGSSWMFQNRVPHILAGDYTPLSAVNIFVKDLGIVLESARDMTFPLPLTAAAHQQFLAASAAGHGGEDDSAVIKVFDALTPIELPAKKS
jgi:3-hydroxyisobutyrate dehydrogenase